MKSSDIGAVIVCAGKGERTGLTYNKILHRLGHKTVIETVLDKFGELSIPAVVVAAEADMQALSDIAAGYDNVTVCLGGSTRAKSVLNGLKALGKCDIVVIHDGARPFFTKKLILDSIDAAEKHGSGIAAVPSVDTVKRSANGKITTLPRAELFNAQTPQTFVYADILDAYNKLGDAPVTDDAEVFERAGFTPHLIDGEYANTKITNAADLYRVLPASSRVGIGFDVHRLVTGRPLILGGVTIPHEKGLDGHSDADVLTHAIMDALLSAAGLPDIGVLFPDTAAETLGADSLLLLDDVIKRVAERKFAPVNVSAVVIAQKPKLAGYIPAIRESLAARLSLPLDSVNISATTTEKLGLIGSGDAIAADATCLLTEIYDRR